MKTSLFTAHPASVDETYWEHLGVALSFAWTLLAASLACLIHAVFPFLFVATGSSMIAGLNERMVTGRRRFLPGRLTAGYEGSFAASKEKP